MNSNNQTTQEYSDLSMYQTENRSAPLHNINNNDQQTSINNVGMTSAFIINTLPHTLQNDIFEFYFPLPNYTLLKENVAYNIQSLIRQLIQQQVQQLIYQQNNVQQQSINTTIQPNSQVYSDNNNAYNAVSDNIQDTEFQNSH